MPKSHVASKQLPTVIIVDMAGSPPQLPDLLEHLDRATPEGPSWNGHSLAVTL